MNTEEPPILSLPILSLPKGLPLSTNGRFLQVGLPGVRGGDQCRRPFDRGRDGPGNGINGLLHHSGRL
jgi:hypothetical protein